LITKPTLIGALALTALAAQTPRSRSVSMEYSASIGPLAAGTGQVELWMPVPHDAYQRIERMEVTSPYRYQIGVDEIGNRILHLRADRPSSEPIRVTLRFEATRRERRQELAVGSAAVREEAPRELARWMKPDRLVPLDSQIRAWADEVVAAAHASTDIEKARAIYDHVVASVKYDKSGKGWGRGDIYYACENRRGNCTDFHAIFIGYARATGVPARFSIGFPLLAARGAGQVSGYHCWAEFYAKGIGWIPVDASEAAKDPSRREYFFGAHDENRVEFSRGRDLVLAPPQKGEPLNYFIYPYAEADGKPIEVERTVLYRDLPPAAPVAEMHP
jgi:transglutaminase-like putative cysteine protease